MDATTLEMLRNEPGSIGDTARAYATSFARIVTERTNKPEAFNNGLYMTIMYRIRVMEQLETTEGNLLLPLNTKGVDEIHRLFDLEEPFEDMPFKLDLPTMTLYAMLLESPLYRRGFAEMNATEVLYPLGIIYEEIYKICPYQSIIKRLAFDLENSFRVTKFIMAADKSLKPIILDRIMRK